MKTYSFKNLNAVFGTHEITGFAEGDDAITVEANSESFKTYVGAKGEVTRAMINDESVTIKVKLQQTSKSVAFLQNLHLLDRSTGTVVLPFQIDDFEAGESIKIPKAFISKQPTIVRGAGQNDIEFEFTGDREIPIFTP